jgi:hypothetical protein
MLCRVSVATYIQPRAPFVGVNIARMQAATAAVRMLDMIVYDIYIYSSSILPVLAIIRLRDSPSPCSDSTYAPFATASGLEPSSTGTF